MPGVGDDVTARRDCRTTPLPIDSPMRDEHQQRRDLQAGEQVVHEPARAVQVNRSTATTIARIAMSGLRRHDHRHVGQRNRQQRRRDRWQTARTGRCIRRARPRRRRSRRKTRRRTTSSRRETQRAGRRRRADRRTRRRRAAAASQVRRRPSRPQTRGRRRTARRRAAPRPLGTRPATIIGTKKMPPPMTFEMTIAAASSGPRRRSSVASAGTAVARDSGGVHGCEEAACVRNDPPLELEFSDRNDLASPLREDLGCDVQESRIGERFGAWRPRS